MSIVSQAGKSLKGARVYLSGPMDFVYNREMEEKFGWRARLAAFLSDMKVTVFDPWNKPKVRWFYEYGKESATLQKKIKKEWSYDQSFRGQRARARCAKKFWQTFHVDLRMVDTADFVIAYCPTTIYSVGTVNEIVVARLEYKPVLLVTPHVPLPEIDGLREHLKEDKVGRGLLEDLERRIPIKPNPQAIPSLWYMPLVGGHNCFDGFGFDQFRKKYHWRKGPLDQNEDASPPARPLLPFLRDLNYGKQPQRFDLHVRRNVHDDDWLVWDLDGKGSHIGRAKRPGR